MNSKSVSIDHYLKTIYQLEQKHGVVRSVDIAVAMGFSKPSITRATAVLKDMGYITDSEHEIKLTASGKQEAIKLLQKYQTIYAFLISIGVPVNSAVHDACIWEHSISEETYQKFMAKVN